jgi:nucleoside-diphosphate-sugar epimerase
LNAFAAACRTLLVTGATGFVGQALLPTLVAGKYKVRAVSRRQISMPKCSGIDWITADTAPALSLEGCDAIVHLAARVHVMREYALNPLSEFRSVNVDATEHLARRAAAAGVRRFVFLSSVKVNGEETALGRPFRADDVPAPEDAYGISKQEAEVALRRISTETGMEVVIVRPPLVYGPGVKANFDVMMRWLARGIPLPLAAVTGNRRSLIALDNLVDLIVTCLSHPAAADQTFLASDGEDLSTAALLMRMGQAQGMPARLFYTPVAALKLGAAMLGKQSIYQRLCGSLQVDISKTRELLGWTPPVSVDEGLLRAVREAGA